jgi:diguanylate cyclase (GGDEF)-like protein
MKLPAVWIKFALPLIVLALGVVLTLGLAYIAQREIERSANVRFDAVATDAARKVEDRFAAYTEVLIGLRALFNTTDAVTRSRFREYVAGLNLPANYPGFQCLNFAAYVPAAERRSFEERMRGGAYAGDGAPGFAITPPGERAEYHPFAFAEPIATPANAAVIGKDLGATPQVLQALHLARDSGALTSSGRLIKINGKASDVGLAVRLPIYRAGMPQATAEQRRAAYVGSVGAGFRVADMMRGIVKDEGAGGVRLRLFDGGLQSAPANNAAPLTDDTLLFDSAALAAERPAAPALAESRAGATAAPSAQSRAPVAQTWQRRLPFAFGARVWIVEITQDGDRVVGRLDRAIPWLIAIGGIAVSALLAGIIYALMTSRRRALSIARRMTTDLRASERRLGEAQHLANLGSWILDAETGALHCSDEARRILGFVRKRDALKEDIARRGDALKEGLARRGDAPTAAGERAAAQNAAAEPNLAALLSRVPVDERATVEQAIAAAAQSGERREFEHRLCLPDGTERWVHVIVQTTEENGRRALHGTVRDNTLRQRNSLRLQFEHDIARLLVSDDAADSVLARVLAAICTHLGWDHGAAWRVGADGLTRCGPLWHSDDDAALEQFARVSRSITYRADEGSLGQAWARADAMWVDVGAAARDFTRDALARDAGLATCLVVPMAGGSHSTALEFFSRKARAADAELIESLRAVALQIGQYEQRKQAEQALRHIASHDGLTGLSNRVSLQQRLAAAIKRSKRHQKRMAVTFVDLDRFKHINDTLGHGVGDAMIKACAARIAGVIRESDGVARFGGDEFVLVLEDLSAADDAAVIAHRVLACCAEPFVIDGRELHVTASIGVSVYPEDGADGETLLKNADTAMYRAKEKGRGTFQFYAAQMNEQGTERLMLESGLRRALERGELALHYQPKMNLASHAITGVEALMRWHHPGLGMVTPAQFIPIAEDTGLIESMGRWALATACAQARAWQESGLPPLQMSVNLSPRQLSSPRLINDIADVLAASGLAPALLELEITESAMMQKPEHASALLQEISRMGVTLAIDDFGTGYSSLSYLKRFPLSTVKIDRAFVKDLALDEDAQALADGIITLAHGLRMKVVAEGVETSEQLACLRARLCDEMQGYWLCKPLPAAEVREFIARRSHRLFAVTVAA